MLDVTATKVTPGIGYGRGSISYADRTQAVSGEVLKKVEELITSSVILLPVDPDAQDDGCGDGRPVGRVWKGDVEVLEHTVRAKVFGGAPAMAAAVLIGTEAGSDAPLNEIFERAFAVLDQAGLEFGGHTDTHASGDNCGCGALDKAPQILGNILEYREAITETVLALLASDNADQQATLRQQLVPILDAFAAYVAAHQGEAYSGKAVSDQAKAHGKVVKELTGDHLEAYIVLNMVEGYTVDQAAVRAATGDQVQVFAVDVWRMQAIADKLAESSEKVQAAFLSELVYTLGVAATLTKGDLPVYQITAA